MGEPQVCAGCICEFVSSSFSGGEDWGGVPWSEDEGSQCGLVKRVTASCFLTGQDSTSEKRGCYVKWFLRPPFSSVVQWLWLQSIVFIKLIKVFIVLDYNWIRSKIILSCSLDTLSSLAVYLCVWSFFFFSLSLSKNSFQKAQLNLLLSCSEYLPVLEYSGLTCLSFLWGVGFV